MNNKQQTTATDKYFEQRIVTSGDTITVKISDIHTNNDDPTLHIEAEYDAEVIELQTNLSDTDSKTLLSFLTWFCTDETGKINYTQHVNDTIEIKYNNGEDTFTHLQTGHEFTPAKTTNNETNSTPKEIETTLRQKLITLAYNTSETPHNKDSGMECRVEEFNDPEGKEFSVTIYPHANIPLHWDITLPHVTEITDTALETLIEEQGGGTLKYIKSGTVVIIHKDDITSDLDVIEYDTTGEWALVPPSIHKTWDEQEPDTKTTSSSYSTSNTTNTTSSSTSTSPGTSPSSTSSPTSPRKKKQRKHRGTKVLVHSMVAMLMAGLFPVIPDMILSAKMATEVSVLLNTVESVSHIMGGISSLGVAYGVFLLGTSSM